MLNSYGANYALSQGLILSAAGDGFSYKEELHFYAHQGRWQHARRKKGPLRRWENDGQISMPANRGSSERCVLNLQKNHRGNVDHFEFGRRQTEATRAEPASGFGIACRHGPAGAAAAPRTTGAQKLSQEAAEYDRGS